MALKSDDELMAEIHKHFQNYLSNPENVESSAQTLLEDLIEDAIMNVIFEVDYERKGGGQDILLGEPEDEKFQIIDSPPDVDIFGQTRGKMKSYECICPSCKRNLVASRFAPHLEKCMGMGRNSSRIASRRIASNVNKDIYTTGAVSDDDNDADWTVSNDKKGKRRKEKITQKKIIGSKPKLGRNGGNSNGEMSDLTSTFAHVSLDNLSELERKNIFSQICGVISEHTRKLCTRSPKCPQHTDEQKKMVRQLYLSDNVESDYSEQIQVEF